MKLAFNIGLSLVVLALCLWLVWPNPKEQADLVHHLSRIRLTAFWPYLMGYLALLAGTHFFRAWRWHNLLDPMGVRIGTGKLLAIQSVGFMAILALPARLGEFARPALLREKGKLSGVAVLGNVAVERIVDGLMVSLLVFTVAFAGRGPNTPEWVKPMAWTSLGVFVAATVFLLFALKWPRRTIHIAVSLTPFRWFKGLEPMARKLEEKLHDLIRGFLVFNDHRNLALFAAWSALYWICNGLGMWLLARGFGLDLPLVGAFTTMGIIAVGIMLPNTPGLVGQFQWFTVLGLTLYMPEVVAKSTGLGYAIVLHALQLVWYLTIGGLCMATSHIRVGELLRRTRAETEAIAP